jgi:hypothetical protein
MNGMRKMLCFLMAMVLAAFALPTIAAPEKVFSLSVSPHLLPATGQPIDVTATYTNTTGGNSLINSVVLIPPPGVTLSNARPHDGTVITCPSSTTAGPIPAGSVCIVNMVGTRPGTPFVLVVSATVPSGTACTLSAWNGQSFTGNTLGGTSFRLQPATENSLTSLTAYVGCTGILGCASTNNTGGQLNTNDAGYVGTPDWGIIRGQNTNDPPQACDVVLYQFNFDPGQNTASFIVTDPAKGTQKIAVEYVVLWNAVPPDAAPALTAGWAKNRALLAWGFTTPPVFPTQYSPALACLYDLSDFSDPLSPVNNLNPSLALPTIPNVQPFIDLSKPVSDGGQGLTQYTPNTQAKMCVAQHGITTIGGPIPGGLLQQWDKIIDESDGWVGVP